ncbi:MAG: transcription antitermination factor NusB [Elusimicrobia bacterium RIFCSPHIGHO2_02_FULL_57_9]|nr:MAG: transcription antitermination factor NusB [Elusimicrobia bacterium RIFCSPHIGHO2_02_FULL_57_9]
MGRRRQAREAALQALYVSDISGVDQYEALAIVNRRQALDDPQTFAFARELLLKTYSLRSELDKHISAAAENWTLARMAAVDRNLLRLAAYELIHNGETPVNVIIDEAVEIARKFSTEDSTRFINGILDKIKKERKSG